MATLADIMGNAPSQDNSPREDYLMYAEACMVAGKQPLPFPDWVKAGKPAK